MGRLLGILLIVLGIWMALEIYNEGTRNAFGGAYAAYNSYFVGADMVFAMPMARIAVMGPAGKDFVYKDEIRAIDASYRKAAASGDEAEATWTLSRESPAVVDS